MKNTNKVYELRQDRIFKLDQWNVNSFIPKWIYKPLRLFLFLDAGTFNGGSTFKWSRIWCWFGSHEWRWSYWVDENYNGVVISIPCDRCGFRMEFNIYGGNSDQTPEEFDKDKKAQARLVFVEEALREGSGKVNLKRET